MSWRLAKSLIKLREQINAAYPSRDKTSDGTIGDTAHRNRKSDHNPNDKGVVCAIDIDEDLRGNRTLEQVITAIRASRDKRVKYIIYEGRITEPGSDLQRWKKYTGANPHSHHAHISVNSDPRLYDDARDWSLDGTAQQLPAATQSSLPVLRRGDKGAAVKALQVNLIARHYQLKADGDFGPATERAVRSFQTVRGLTADGIVGQATREALGI